MCIYTQYIEYNTCVYILSTYSTQTGLLLYIPTHRGMEERGGRGVWSVESKVWECGVWESGVWESEVWESGVWSVGEWSVGE